MPVSRMNDATLNVQMLEAAKKTYPDWNINPTCRFFPKKSLKNPKIGYGQKCI